MFKAWEVNGKDAFANDNKQEADIIKVMNIVTGLLCPEFAAPSSIFYMTVTDSI